MPKSTLKHDSERSRIGYFRLDISMFISNIEVDQKHENAKNIVYPDATVNHGKGEMES